MSSCSHNDLHDQLNYNLLFHATAGQMDILTIKFLLLQHTTEPHVDFTGVHAHYILSVAMNPITITLVASL